MLKGKVTWNGDGSCWGSPCWIDCSGKGSLSEICKGQGTQPCEHLQEEQFRKREQQVQKPELGICPVYSRKSKEEQRERVWAVRSSGHGVPEYVGNMEDCVERLYFSFYQLGS